MLKKMTNKIIYDLLGNKVRTLFNGQAFAGLNKVRWDGKNSHNEVVNSGIYLYSIISNEAVFNGKMILNK